MKPGTLVLINSTEDLPTIHDGVKGEIFKAWKTQPGYFTVLVWTTGETQVFHESQLTVHPDNDRGPQ